MSVTSRTPMGVGACAYQTRNIALGGSFAVGRYANVAAELCSKFQEKLLNKDYTQAKNIDNKLSKLHSALFIESNPSPVKYAASLLKLSLPEVRLPLVKVKDSTKKEIEKALKVADLL